MPGGQRKCSPQRRGVAGHDVEGARTAAAGPLRLDRGHETGAVEAVAWFADGRHLDIEHLGRADDPHVARTGYQQRVLRPGDESAHRQEDGLLASDGDDEGLRCDVNILVLAQRLRDDLANPAGGRTVLEDPVPDHLGRLSAVGEMVEVAPQVGEDLLGVEKPVVGTTWGEGDGLGIPRGDLVEKVHRVQDGVRDGGVQVRLAKAEPRWCRYVTGAQNFDVSRSHEMRPPVRKSDRDMARRSETWCCVQFLSRNSMIAELTSSGRSRKPRRPQSGISRRSLSAMASAT